MTGQKNNILRTNSLVENFTFQVSSLHAEFFSEILHQ